MIVADSISVDELLLVLKVAFLVLLYLFIWRIVRTASRELNTSPAGRAVSNESMVLAPGQAAALGLNRRGGGDLVVVRSTTLRTGERYPLDAAALTVGRSSPHTWPSWTIPVSRRRPNAWSPRAAAPASPGVSPRVRPPICSAPWAILAWRSGRTTSSISNSASCRS